MRFSTAIDSVTQENRNLRFLVKFLSATSLLLSLAVLLLYDKTPVAVERSSRGLEIVKISPFHRSEEETKLAVALMLKARFESSAVNPELYLSQRQLELRSAEQAEMKARGLNQGILFRSAQLSKDAAVAEFDRVLSVGDVRSALKTQIKIAFEEVTPNELNPYGLKLALADPIDAKETANATAGATAESKKEETK